jgi:hypothetical protein
MTPITVPANPVRSRWPFAAAAVLLAIFFLQLFFASRAKSPAWDEPGHIASGVAYIQKGALTVNPEHPPLLKALSGMFLTWAGARWPDTDRARELLNGAAEWQWAAGSYILVTAGLDRALQWGRLPMMLVSLMAALVVYLWGRQLAGEIAGLGGLLLFTLDPTIMAHSYLVTLDVGLGAFTLLFLFCLWHYARSPKPRTLVLCGVTLGLLLCTKFSSLVILPCAAILLLAARATSASAKLTAQRTARKAAPDAPCPCGSGKKYKNCHAAMSQSRFDLQSALACAPPLLYMGGIALAVIWAVYRFHSPLDYVHGVSLVNQNHQANYVAFLGGQLAPRFTSYFAVAYLLKEPLPAIALAAIGLFFVLRPKSFLLRDRLFLLLPPAVFFLVHVWKADDLGIRYIIPCLPFAHLLGGIGIAVLIRSPARAARPIAICLSLWMAIAAAGIYPDGLSYFNESACLLNDPSKLGRDGGSGCGAAWLDDSNIDWGEGLKSLKGWLSRNAAGRSAKLAYFGSFPPAAYSMPVEVVEDSQLDFQPGPGLYAISAHLLAHHNALVNHRLARGDEWTLRVALTAIIGHCIYLYDLRAE